MNKYLEIMYEAAERAAVHWAYLQDGDTNEEEKYLQMWEGCSVTLLPKEEGHFLKIKCVSKCGKEVELPHLNALV